MSGPPTLDATRLRRELLAWFDHARRDLPWRRTKDAYAIWVSEVMLQQTQVVTVIPYWHRFLERFPTVQTLAQAELPEVFALWKGLGYYSRARNLHRAAQVIATAHGGVLPSSAAALLALPGFGRYTAGAVASIAWGEAAPLVDGNVARVFSRLFQVPGATGDRARDKQLWALAETLVAGERPGDWNQALMELGATVCRSDAPACDACPIRAQCGAHASGQVDRFPAPRVRAPRQKLRIVAAAWADGDKLLFARRPEGGLFGGLWELPSVEVDEAAPAADVDRALRLLLPQARIGRHLGAVQRVLTHRNLTVDVFEVHGRPSRVHAHARVQEWRWATAEEAAALGMSTAMSKALALAQDALAPPSANRTSEMSPARRKDESLSSAEPAHRRPTGAGRGGGTTQRSRNA